MIRHCRIVGNIEKPSLSGSNIRLPAATSPSTQMNSKSKGPGSIYPPNQAPKFPLM